MKSTDDSTSTGRLFFLFLAPLAADGSIIFDGRTRSDADDALADSSIHPAGAHVGPTRGEYVRRRSRLAGRRSANKTPATSWSGRPVRGATGPRRGPARPVSIKRGEKRRPTVRVPGAVSAPGNETAITFRENRSGRDVDALIPRRRRDLITAAGGGWR